MTAVILVVRQTEIANKSDVNIFVNKDTPTTVSQHLDQLENEKIVQPSLIEPIAEFKSRITKKLFGIYITSENSLV